MWQLMGKYLNRARLRQGLGTVAWGSSPPASSGIQPNTEVLSAIGRLAADREVSDFRIQVCYLTGKTIDLDVNPDDTIELVKVQIYDKERIPTSEQCLLFGCIQLDDETELCKYNIQKDSELTLLLQTSSSSSTGN